MEKNLIKLSLAVALGAMLVACEPSNPSSGTTEGTVGELSCNRSEIYIAQPTTFTGTYTPGKGIDPSKTTCAVRVLDQAGKELSLQYPFSAQIKDGNVVASLNCLPQAGELTVEVKIGEAATKAEPKYIIKTSKINVKAGQPDIRNCSWGDSKEICKENIKFYDFDKWGFNEQYIEVIEENYYPLEYSNMHESESSSALRQVFYKFTNNRLEGIDYLINLKKEKNVMGVDGITYIVKYFIGHEHLLSKDYYGISGFKRSYWLKENYTPTPEEDALVKEFVNGTLKTDDANGTLGKAIQAGNINLEINAGNAKNDCLMTLRKNSEGNIPTIGIRFTPKK